MSFADGTEATVFAGKSTTLDTEPTTYDQLLFTDITVQGQQDTFEDETIDPSGKGIDQIRHSLRGGGGLNFHWRPAIFDSNVETLLRGAFGSALSQTGLTLTFGTPNTTTGLQQISDDLTGGVLGAGRSEGDLILVTGAADATNNGLKMVISVTDNDTIEVYNPTGIAAAGDTGCGVSHNGVATLGKSAIYQWLEILESDGNNLIYSEFYKNGIIDRMDGQFPAAGESRFTFNYQMSDPSIVRAGGSPPITKQRTGSDNSLSTARAVHGMEDLQQLIVYTSGQQFDLTKLMTLFSFSIQRTVVNHAVTGTSAIVNRGITRPRITMQLNALLTSADDEAADLSLLRSSNPDTASLFLVFGATQALSYGIYFDTLRVTGAPVPPQPGGNPTTVNAALTATDVRFTRIS